MTEKPPTRIVIAKPPRKRPGKAMAADVTTVRVVYAPQNKRRDAWRRFMALTGRDDDVV